MTFRTHLWFILTLLAVLGWLNVAVFLFALAKLRASGFFAMPLAWAIMGGVVLLTTLGTWGAVALRPRRRASHAAVDEFRRSRSRGRAS